MRTVRSLEEEARNCPQGDQEREVIESVCDP